jgi:hypothetical protein
VSIKLGLLRCQICEVYYHNELVNSCVRSLAASRPFKESINPRCIRLKLSDNQITRRCNIESKRYYASTFFSIACPDFLLPQFLLHFSMLGLQADNLRKRRRAQWVDLQSKSPKFWGFFIELSVFLRNFSGIFWKF